jgi:hypothetical protein
VEGGRWKVECGSVVGWNASSLKRTKKRKVFFPLSSCLLFYSRVFVPYY